MTDHAIVVADANGTITWRSPGAEVLFGHSAASAIGQSRQRQRGCRLSPQATRPKPAGEQNPGARSSAQRPRPGPIWTSPRVGEIGMLTASLRVLVLGG